MKLSDEPKIWALIDNAGRSELRDNTDSNHAYRENRRAYVSWLIQACRSAAGPVDNDGNHVIKSYTVMRSHHDRIMGSYLVGAHPALTLAAVLTLWTPYALRVSLSSDAATAIAVRELSRYTKMLAYCTDTLRQSVIYDLFPVTSVEYKVYMDGMIDALVAMYAPATLGGSRGPYSIEEIIADVLSADDSAASGWMEEACGKADTLFWLLSSHP